MDNYVPVDACISRGKGLLRGRESGNRCRGILLQTLPEALEGEAPVEEAVKAERKPSLAAKGDDS